MFVFRVVPCMCGNVFLYVYQTQMILDCSKPFFSLRFTSRRVSAVAHRNVIYVFTFLCSNLRLLYASGCCGAEAWSCLFCNRQVHVARRFAAVTSGLDFIFSDIWPVRCGGLEHVCSVCLGSDGNRLWQ